MVIVQEYFTSTFRHRPVDSDFIRILIEQKAGDGFGRSMDGMVASAMTKLLIFYRKEDFTSKHLWRWVKPMVRQIESDDGIIIFDDTVEEKPYTDENELITWHYDHIAGRSVKGTNILNALYHNRGMTVPIAFQPIKKTEKVVAKRSGQEVRKSPQTKNEYLREMARIALQDNQIKCKWILADVWFSSNDNMEYIKLKLLKDFSMPIKSNRLVARSEDEKRNGQFQRVEEIAIPEHTALKIYIKELPFPVLLVKQVFKNEDGSSGILYPVCSDATAIADSIIEVYQKRWRIEEFHKSIKSNTGLAKSPTKTVRTQNNHFFASIYAYFKLEMLKANTQLNHFALKASSKSQYGRITNITKPYYRRKMSL